MRGITTSPRAVPNDTPARGRRQGAQLEALEAAGLGRWRISTPATETGSRYAWLPETAVRSLPAGDVMLLGILASLQRPRGDLILTRSELAASSGYCRRSVRDHLRTLAAAGWVHVDEDGAVRLDERCRQRPGSGRWARVDVTRWAELSPALCRFLAGLALFCTKAWAERTKRVHFHFIPTSSSWLNLVERFFSTLTQKRIRRGVFHSVGHLESCLKQYIETHNENPRPFVWTKSAAQIIEKVHRARKALAAASA